MKAYAAEFVGTFALIFEGCGWAASATSPGSIGPTLPFSPVRNVLFAIVQIKAR